MRVLQQRLKRRVFKCPKCRLVIDGQKNASINILKTLLRMWDSWIHPERSEAHRVLQRTLRRARALKLKD
ncbi:MAG: zinc ribbon domain-containing protein [Sulfolobales archaeon]